MSEAGETGETGEGLLIEIAISATQLHAETGRRLFIEETKKRRNEAESKRATGWRLRQRDRSPRRMRMAASYLRFFRSSSNTVVRSSMAVNYAAIISYSHGIHMFRPASSFSSLRQSTRYCARTTEQWVRWQAAGIGA